MKKIPIVPEIIQTPSKRQFVEAHTITAQSIPIAVWTTIDYNVITRNLNSNYSGGVFTASNKGLYNITGAYSQAFDPAGNFTMYIRINIVGSSGNRVYTFVQSEDNATTAFNFSRQLAKTVYLEQGDTVEIQAFNNHGTFNLVSTLGYNHTSIVELERLD